MVKKERIINWVLVSTVTILLASALMSYLTKGAVYFLFRGDTAALSQMISGNGFAVVLFILLIAIEVIVAPIPALVLYVAGGLMFGPLLGGLYSIIGNLVGAALAFVMARYWARGYFEKKVSLKMRNKFDKFSIKHGPLAIFILRVNPLTSSDLFSYVAGLSKMNFWKFILGTGLGLAPLVYAQTYVGDALSHNTFLVNLFMLISAVYVLGFTAVFLYIQWKNTREGRRARRIKRRKRRRNKRRRRINAKLSPNKKR